MHCRYVNATKRLTLPIFHGTQKKVHDFNYEKKKTLPPLNQYTCV